MKILALTLVALLSLLSTAALSQTPEALRNDILNFSHFSSDAGDAWGQDKSGAKQPADKNSDDPTKINLVTGQGDVSEVNYHPLNNHQRMKLWVNSSFTTPGAYFGSIGNALVDQAGGNPKEWGGGLKGYGRRVASRFGSNLVQGAVQSSFAAMLHEDPRYIRSGSRKLSARLTHAVVFGVVTFNDNGHKTLNIANLASFYGSSLASSTWVPHPETRASYVGKDGSRQLAFSCLNNVFQEFWPDISKLFHHK